MVSLVRRGRLIGMLILLEKKEIIVPASFEFHRKIKKNAIFEKSNNINF
jgi:hypothetical protein